MALEFSMQFTFTSPRFTRQDAEDLIELAAMADDFGLHSVGTGDTGFRLGDAASRVTLMALGTRRAYVGMRPTNPWTRDPQVTAGFLASIDSITDGRAFMEVATGDSAVTSVGRKPATRARLEEYVRCVRDLLAGGEGTYDGRVLRCFGGPRPPVRISIGAEGPRMLHLAGRIGDAVSIGTGLTPEVVSDSLARVQRGAEEAGRPSGAVEPWFTVRSVLHQNGEAARIRLRPSLASILHHSMRFGAEDRLVPEQHVASVARFIDRYALRDHQQAGGSNETLLLDLGLVDFAYQRWGLAGDPNDWVARLTELEAAGIRRVWLSNRGSVMELREALRLFGDKVLPQLA